MVAKKRYPLEALASVRHRATTQATEKLAGERAEEARAEASHREAKSSEVKHREGTTRTVREEAARLEDGALSAADLAALEAYRARRAIEEEELVKQTETRAETLRGANERVQGAERALIDRATEEKVVEKHRTKFVADAKNEQLYKDELESEDLRK